MKWFLSLSLLLLVETFAVATPAPTPVKYQFTYRVRIVAGTESCSTQAESLGQRFAQATGAQVVKSECRDQVQVEYDQMKYTLNSLAVTYVAETYLNSYVAEIGRTNLLSPIEVDQTVYKTYSDCVTDLAQQESLFKTQTALTLVASYCEIESTAMTHHYVLKMEGFDKNKNPRPKKRLFSFIPSIISDLDIEKRQQVLEIISAQAATTVNTNLGTVFYYYADFPVSVRGMVFSFFNDLDQCQSQLGQGQSILQKSKAKKSILWCEKLDVAHSFVMQTISDGSEVSDDAGTFSTHYYSFAECLKDRDYVLNDGRHERVLGGLCAPSTARDGEFLLHLYSKLY